LFTPRHLNAIVGVAFFVTLVFVGYFTIIRQKKEGVILPVFFPVQLETAEGLKVGARVSVLGVPAGSVDSLYFVEPDEGEGAHVIALLAINQSVVFFKNYRIITKYPTALAAKVVEINPGRKISEDDRPVHPRFMASRELVAAKRTGVLPAFGPGLLRAANYDDPLYLIASALTENRKALRKIARNVAEVTDKLNNGRGTLAAILNRPDLANGTNEIMKGAIILIQEIREGIEDTRESRAFVDFLSVITQFTGLKK